MDLEKELTCSICTEVLYQPLTLLDCLHTFCGSCLKEWFSWQHTSARNNPNSLPAGTTPYTCPSCRAPVRDTKHNATVTTLVDMIVAASPEKGKSDEEKEELKSKYTPGENVLLKVEEKEKTLRERRVEDADRRLMNEVRDLSLREVGVESPEARRERRRREESRSRGTRVPRSRDPSRDGRSVDERDRERRRRREAERQGSGSNGTLQPESESTEDRRRRRSDERRSRNDESTRTAARQIEHQSSLRSLISASDVDSREMEEEILRQIREEGLLDGIDLENIDVGEQDQISERIAEAFRRRQSERARQEPARRSNTSATSGVSAVSSISTAGAVGGEQRRRRTHSSAPDSRENSGDDTVRPSARRQRAHSRSPSSVSQDQPSRPPQSMSAVQAAHLEIQSGDEGRHRRRRTSSSSRSATTPTPVAEAQARPAARSQTDLSNRPQSANFTSTRPAVSASTRSTTDPIVAQAGELPVSAPRSRSRASSNSSPRLRSTARMEDSSSSTTRTERWTRAPPENIFVPAAGPLAIPSSVADQSLISAPLSPRGPQHSGSLSDRAHALSSGSRPSSSGSVASRNRPQFYPEPSITCNRCAKPHIEYELHYNCGICHNGNWNICLSCYRSGAGCLYWFGFGKAAWAKWEKLSQGGEHIERPHMLTGSRYLPPRTIPGGADGRRTLTTDDPQKRLQSGTFCASCLAWTNECYWRCDLCNEGDWGFCNICVNQGKSCTHPLLPLTYKPAETNTPPLSPTHDQRTPASASILTGPGVMDIGPFKPLTFSTKCDNCHYPIQPSQSRYHCYSCVSNVPNTLPGDYDICTTCYPKLVSARRISVENGQNGWRRCLQGHRMVIVGFEDSRGGQRRVIVQDLVGGRGLSEQQYAHTDHSGAELQKWTWGDGIHIRGDDTHVRLVTKDVMKTAPTISPDLTIDSTFPPDGGVGTLAVAIWPWWPTPNADDELMFPRGAEVNECKNVNDDWWHGTYMGKRGLFPAPYVETLDTNM